MKVMVSACLLGNKCRYDGKSCPDEKIIEYLRDKEFIPICPERMGGLSVPRESCEIVNGRVIAKSGNDYTEAFYKGSNKVLEIFKNEKIEQVILKSKSPSCGYKKVYDGTFTGNLALGNGICARLLEENGANIINSDEFVVKCDKESKNIL